MHLNGYPFFLPRNSSQRIGITTLTHYAHITSYHRLKGLRDEVDKLEDRLKMAERNVTSLEAQRKAAVADKGRLSKQVTCPLLMFECELICACGS